MANRISPVSASAPPRSRVSATQAARKSSRRKRIKTFLMTLLLLGETALALGLLFGLVLFWKFTQEMPSVEAMVTDIRAPEPTTFYSEDGVVLAQLQVENRQPIPLAEMPKDLLNATVAIEDHRFYDHPGVDAQGIARSVWKNATGLGRSTQGGSTLTQQLVRNLDHFGLTKEKRMERKVREALIALRMEQVYTKKEILELYLNNVLYASGAYGVQAASKTFFGKSASKLTLAEAAFLAGLPQRPTVFNPFRNPKAAIKRRNQVLDKMLEYGFITEEVCKRGKLETPKILPARKTMRYNFKAPHFVQYVYADLKKRYGEEFVKSGLKIYTTLNWQMQQEAERALEIGLERGRDMVGSSCPNQGAVVSIDNRTGYIRALVGSRNFKDKNFDYVTMGARQPGSTFKVFDYAAAFDTGVCELYSSFPDKPIPYPGDPRRRVVKNYGGGYSYGNISCYSAIQWSKNTIAVQVARKTGITTVIDYAKKMGITTKLRPFLPTALGASEVRPLDLAVAYSVFPMKGSRCVPMAVTKILDAESNIVEEHLPKIKMNVLKEYTVNWIDKGLEAVVTAGTGTRARGVGEAIVEGARGKTGTTNDNLDAWFAGYTPELSTVVWVAREVKNSKGRAAYLEMSGGTGGQLCAPIWRDFMLKAVPIQRKFTESKKQPTGIPLPATEQDEKPTTRRRERTQEDPAERATPETTEEEMPDIDAPTPDAEPAPERENSERETSESEGPVTAPPTTPAPETTLPTPESNLTRRNTTPAVVASQPGRNSVLPSARTSPPAANVTTRSAPPPTRVATPPPEPEMVSAKVCVDSGQLANDYCPAVRSSRMTARERSRMRRCREHKPPPGEG